MFDAVRNNKRIVQIFLMLIVIPFAVWGLESLRTSGNDYVATVDGSKITTAEFQFELQNYQQSLRQQFPGATSEGLDSPEVRRRLLDELINQRILKLEADKLGLIVTDATLTNMIHNTPDFRDPATGQFSPTIYRQLLESRGMNPVWVEAKFREQLRTQALLGTIERSAIVPNATQARLQELLGEVRQVQGFVVSWEEVQGKVVVDPAEIQKFHEANSAKFMAPEQMRVEYVQFSQKDLDALGAANKELFVEAADQLRDMAFNQSESLDPIIEHYKLTLQQSGWISRVPNLANGLLGNPKLVAALFTDGVIREGHNAEAIEVSPGVIVVARMLEHKPAALRPLEEVSSIIEAQLRREKAVVLAVEQGKEKLAALKAGNGDKSLAWGKVQDVTILAPAPGMFREALSAVFRVNPEALPGYAGAELPDVGYSIYRVSKVTPGQMQEAEAMGVKDVQKAVAAETQKKAYTDALRQKADIKINEEVLGAKRSD